MRIIFAGTPKFSLPSLKALIDSPHEIVAVYTKQDKPAGRGLKLSASPVKELALKNGLKVLQPKTLRNSEVQDEMRSFNADIFVDVACGFLLPKEVLEMPPLGCVNIHPSLLPRWRGAAPIERTVLAGDRLTGVTIMEMDEGFDTGAILLQETVAIEDRHLTAGELSEELSHIGARLLVFALSQIENGEIEKIIQDDSKANYAEKITKEEAKIDWQKSAAEIDRMIRAFNPRPGANFSIPNSKYNMVKIWQAQPLEEKTDLKPGTVINVTKQGIDVACGKGSILHLTELQFPGGKKLSPLEIYNSKKAAPGLTFL